MREGHLRVVYDGIEIVISIYENQVVFLVVLKKRFRNCADLALNFTGDREIPIATAMTRIDINRADGCLGRSIFGE